MIRNEMGRLEMSPLPPVKKAKIVIIGEFPNATEIREGQYFISDGADVLRKTLSQCGILIEDCYFTVACPYLMSKKNKVIPPERYQRERNRLLQEIKDSGATLVMPLGAFTTCVLLNKKALPITRVLGNQLDIAELPGVSIIPQYHPAVLMHNPGQYKVFQNVINTVAQAYLGQTLDAGITQWSYCESREELKQLIEDVQKRPWVSADIETTPIGHTPVLIWNLGIQIAKNVSKVVTREAMVFHPDLIRQLFSLPTLWVWHHGKYDTTVWHNAGFTEARLDHDTMYQHYCLNETNGTHSLGKCSTVYLGADEYKSEMNSQFKFITTEEEYYKHKDALCARVAIDADYTGQLFEVFKPMIENEPDFVKLYNKILMPAANFLRKVEMRGMKIDREYLLSRVPYYESEIEEMTTAIQDAASTFWNQEAYREQTGAKTASDVFKPTSVKQLAWLIYDRLKLKPKLRGAPKRGTGEEVLESIENPPEFILRILDLRKIKKEFATYVMSYLKCADTDDIVHPTFNLHITATGRLSCVEPNVQNVPSGKAEVRDSFVPRGPGRVLMEVDYSGAELRVLAYLSNDKKLTEALVNGDLHSEVAVSIFGDAYTNGTSQEMKNLRGKAKTVNFGIAYGRGAGDLSNTFDVTKEEAQRWIDTWALMYTDAWAYLQSCEDAVRRGETLTTLFGRHRRFGLIHQGNIKSLSNEAKNFRVQSISSDNTLLAAMEADSTLEYTYDAYIINLIHDSVLIDCPADPATVKAIASYMMKVMVETPIKEYNCTVPFHSDVDIGARWGSLASYDVDTETVNYKKEEFSYSDWIQSKGVSF